MFARRLTVLLGLASILFLGGGLVSPASAAAPPAVTSVTVDGQAQGAAQSWRVTASWVAADASAEGYRVTLTNSAGTADYAHRDVAGTVTSTTLSSGDLLAGHGYKVTVVAFSGIDEAAPVDSDPFTAMTLDTTAPTGTFTVTPTHEFLATDFIGLDQPSATVLVRQTSLSDDSPGAIGRQLLAGDGTAAKPWTSGTTIELTYTRAGTFTPKVLATDVYGNTATISLSPVTISFDGTAPVVRVTKPAGSMLHRIAGWQRIRGTATDTGSGVQAAAAMVLEKRAGIWYAYDFGHRRWLKGYATEGKTLARTKAFPAFTSVSSTGQWHTPRLRGLKRGTLSIRCAAFDASGNVGEGPTLRVKITRS